MKDWLELAGLALVACIVWGTIPILLLSWRRKRDGERAQDRAAVAALQARIEHLEAASEHRDHE